MHGRRGAIGLWLLWFAVLFDAQGCGREEPAADSEQTDSGSSTVVPIAKLGDEVITAPEVMSLMAEKNLGAEQALDQLVDEAVLFQAAREAGIEETPQDRREIERLMVRALLRDYERELSPERMSDEDVRAAFEEYREKLRVPEKRASTHVLARDQGAEAKQLAERALREFRSEDLETVLTRYAEGRAEHPPQIELVAEELPAFSMNAGIDDAYKNALFEADAPGPLREPVKTAYGWHAIVLTEIVPGSEPSLERSETQLRQWLAQRKRQENIVQTVEPLEALVEWNEPVVRKLTRAERLPVPPQPGPRQDG